MTLDAKSLVIVGSWNVAILSPDWLVSEVLKRPAERTPVQVTFEMNLSSPPILRIEEVEYLFRPDRIEIRPSSASDAHLSEIERIASKIVEKLPYTPISAMGLNFNFSFDDVEPESLAKFNIDNEVVSAIVPARKVSSTLIRKVIDLDEGSLRFDQTISPDGKLVTIFNFHHELRGTDDARRILDGGSFARCKTIARDILTSFLHIEAAEFKGRG